MNIYIHIPFCKKKCYYCDFVSYSNKNELAESYINAIVEEIENEKLDKYNIETVYIGGGTPSILDGKYIEKILSKIKFDKNAEITIEVNPGTVSKEKLENYKKLGINRLSIGLQSTSNSILKQIR